MPSLRLLIALIIVIISAFYLLSNPEVRDERGVFVAGKTSVEEQSSLYKKEKSSESIELDGIDSLLFDMSDVDAIFRLIMDTLDPSLRSELIRESNNIPGTDMIMKVIGVYYSYPDRKSAESIVASTIISEIHDDDKLDYLFDNLTLQNEYMVADFVSAAHRTRSYNAFEKLLTMLGYGYLEQVDSRQLVDGIKITYDGTVIGQDIDYIGQWMFQHTSMTKEQEEIIFSIIGQRHTKNTLELLNTYKNNFSDQAVLVMLMAEIESNTAR